MKQPEEGRHAEQGSLTDEGRRVMNRINREFFRRRVDVRRCKIPGSLSEAWKAEVVTPPIRWKTGQDRTTVRVPAYTLRDLARAA